MPTFTPAPKPPARTDEERRQSRIASVKKLERSRSSSPSRTAPPKRKAPPAKRNAKRAKANHERAYGDYAKWIRTLPCVACGVVGHSEAAHTASGGKGRKADASTLAPLCGPHTARVYCLWDGIGKAMLIEGCHRQSHRIGIQTFEAKYHVDLKAIAAQLWADYSRVS